MHETTLSSKPCYIREWSSPSNYSVWYINILPPCRWQIIYFEAQFQPEQIFIPTQVLHGKHNKETQMIDRQQIQLIIYCPCISLKGTAARAPNAYALTLLLIAGDALHFHRK